AGRRGAPLRCSRRPAAGSTLPGRALLTSDKRSTFTVLPSGASALLIERVCTGTADLFFQVCVLPSHGWRRRCRFCDACGNQVADMANSTTSAPPHLLARGFPLADLGGGSHIQLTDTSWSTMRRRR